MLLDDLKQQTRLHHTRLEEINGMPRSRTEYVALLEAFYGYVVAWEKWLAKHVGADDAIRQGREKTPWLEADLNHFGYSAADRQALPQCSDLPTADSRDHLLGASYVLEGATLGGQFIARHLETTLGLTGGNGYRFFRSYGGEVGARWNDFRTELLRHSSPESDPRIIDGAKDAFDKLAVWFAARRPVAA